jgi:hypothetical protein
MRDTLRSESEAPKLKKSSTDRSDPSRIILLKDNAEPKDEKSYTEN